MSYLPDPQKIAEATKAITSIVGNAFTLDYKRSPFTIRFSFGDYGNGSYNVAGFTLVEQTNCCGILVSTHTWVDSKHQGEGIAQEMQPVKVALARIYGYSLLLATVRMDNAAEIHILDKFGWKQNTTFVNARTKNEIGIYTLEIPKE